jgi:thiol-disulfide isomerase/thioredoxin
MKRLNIQILSSIANRRGGRCLSKRYVNFKIPLYWQCAFGHRWRALATNVKNRGSWCPDCAGVKRLTLNDMRVLATHRGGDCLSKQYVNDDTKLTWRCANGHLWRAEPVRIKRGHWCPYCAHAVRLTLQELDEEANRRGGRCLSTTYVNVERRLRWKCAVAHEWDATAASIRRGSWCPHCARNQKLRLEEMQQIAQERGGKCISKSYTNGRTNLVWECARGHCWKASPSNVKGGLRKRGTWCLKCYDLRRAFHTPADIEKMRDLAKARGGRCVSREYVNSKTHIEWGCEEGHHWRAVPHAVARGSWCPICARNQRLTLEQFQVLARHCGGKCLSDEYKNKETRLQWQCAAGHEWLARPGEIKRGSWCNKCAIERRRSRWKKPGEIAPLLEETITVLVSFLRFSKVFFPGARERNAFCSLAGARLRRLLQRTRTAA